MKILMVEDERMVARGIKRMVSKLLEDQEHTLVHVPSLEEAQSYLESNKIDLLLLDLNLSGEDGFELLSDLTSHEFQTIIISANTDRALESYEYGVLDFVPKPVSEGRLQKALGKLSESDEGAADLNRGNGQAAFLSVKVMSKTKIINTNEVSHIEAAGKYSEILSVSGGSDLHEKNLRALLKVLPPNFQRIHRSTLANLDYASHITSYEGSRYELSMRDGLTLRIGRSYVEALRARLM